MQCEDPVTHVSVQEVKSDLQAILQRVRSGEEVTLEENGVPFGRLTPIPNRVAPLHASYRTGLLNGQAKNPDNWKEIGMDDFDEAVDRNRLL